MKINMKITQQILYRLSESVIGNPKGQSNHPFAGTEKQNP